MPAWVKNGDVYKRQTNNLQANEIAGYNALNDIVGIGELRGTRYTYTYDKYGRIVEIACGENNKTLEKYGYKERSNTYIDSIISVSYTHLHNWTN